MEKAEHKPGLSFVQSPRKLGTPTLSSPMQVTAGQNEVCNEGLLSHATWIS